MHKISIEKRDKVVSVVNFLEKHHSFEKNNANNIAIQLDIPFLCVDFVINYVE